MQYTDLGGVALTEHIQATGDFNGDGRDDILWRDDAGHNLMWDSPADSSGDTYSVQDLGVISSDWQIV